MTARKLGNEQMNYRIKNITALKKILWADALLGGSNAVIGLLFSTRLTNVLGLSRPLILIISGITLLYAIIAFVLANQRPAAIPLLRTLVAANWIWTVISVILLFIHYDTATIFGAAFLILQVLVVGALAYLEGNQILKNPI